MCDNGPKRIDGRDLVGLFGSGQDHRFHIGVNLGGKLGCNAFDGGSGLEVPYAPVVLSWDAGLHADLVLVLVKKLLEEIQYRADREDIPF